MKKASSLELNNGSSQQESHSHICCYKLEVEIWASLDNLDFCCRSISSDEFRQTLRVS